MLILKLEQNLFQELDPGKMSLTGIKKVTTWLEGDSVFRSTPVDFFEGVSSMTMEKRKYPYFYKYYLYFNEEMEQAIELKSEEGARFLLAFYQKYHPEYVKDPVYKEEMGMKPEVYFYMEKIPGASMQRFVPGKGLEEEISEEKKNVPAMSGNLEGYHEFSQEEKQDIGGQLDALKDQFADQLKELEALMGKK